MRAYHDEEWGVPLHDDHRLFEMLILEGAQAGLSWETVLRKRTRYRELFRAFDPAAVARMTPARVERLMLDPGIIRNRAKIESAISNARVVLDVQQEFGSLDAYLWRFVDGTPILNKPRRPKDVPASTPRSLAMSRELVAPRFPIRRPDDLLRIHAGDGHGKRSSPRLRLAPSRLTLRRRARTTMRSSARRRWRRATMRASFRRRAPHFSRPGGARSWPSCSFTG